MDLSGLRPELLSEATSKYIVVIQEHNEYCIERYQVTYRFPNDYGVSVIQNFIVISGERTPASYGAEEGLYEAALIRWLDEVDFEICQYGLLDSPYDQDVNGYLTPEDVERLLLWARDLPAESPYTPERIQAERDEREAWVRDGVNRWNDQS